MKQIVNEKEFTPFLERFNNFYDSNIQSVTYSFNKGGSSKVDISILANDLLNPDAKGWTCVVVSLDQLSEMTIIQSKNIPLMSIANGIHLSVIDGEIALEFGGHYEQPENPEEFRKADAYAIGKTLSFEVFSPAI